MVDQALTLEPVADTHFGEQFDRALFEDAGAHAFLDVLARAHFEHYGIDAFQVQKMRKDESRGTRADYANLRALALNGISHPALTSQRHERLLHHGLCQR